MGPSRNVSFWDMGDHRKSRWVPSRIESVKSGPSAQQTCSILLTSDSNQCLTSRSTVP